MKRGWSFAPGKAGIAVVREKIQPAELRRLVPPPYHHRRDGSIGGFADRGRQCRLAVGFLQGPTKDRQIAKARRRAAGSRLGEVCCPANIPRSKAACPKAGDLEVFGFETGRDNMRSCQIPPCA